MPSPRLRGIVVTSLLALAPLGCETAVAPEDAPCDGPTSGPLCLRPVVEGLEFPIHLTAPPGHDWVVVVEQKGIAHVLEGDTLRAEPFLDLRDVALYPDEQGLLGLTFDPDFARNGVFYANYTELDGRTRLSRFRVGADPRVADRATEEKLLSIPRVLGLHNAGTILFGPDGYLWIATGDGWKPTTAQDLSILRGSILRVDVRGGGAYSIPPDNPFVGDAEALPEIWMYGFRNPWGFHIDTESGMVYIADVGHERREELNVVPWRSPGANFGWATLEGSLCNEEGCSPDGTVLPALEYGHDEGCAIIGGTVYRGTDFPELRGHYFYADLCGVMRSLRWEGGQIVDERSWSTEAIGQIIAIREGAGGELWILTFDGGVYRVEPAP